MVIADEKCYPARLVYDVREVTKLFELIGVIVNGVAAPGRIFDANAVV